MLLDPEDSNIELSMDDGAIPVGGTMRPCGTDFSIAAIMSRHNNNLSPPIQERPSSAMRSRSIRCRSERTLLGDTTPPRSASDSITPLGKFHLLKFLIFYLLLMALCSSGT